MRSAGGGRSPCGPGNELCGAPFGVGAPRFHIMDRSCGNNDPNAPFFDKRHGVYHIFFQDHLSKPDGQWAGKKHGYNVVWGHAISRDLTRW